MKSNRISWKRRYLNLLIKFRKMREEVYERRGAELNRQWEIETGRRNA